MINRATLLGNLGRDPEIRTTGSGMAVGTLRVATTHRTKDRDGNWQEATEWHSVTVFGKTAENCQRYLTKGRQVYVEGRIQTRKWQDKEGKDRYSTEVVADIVKFVGGKTAQGGSQDGGKPSGGYGGGGGYSSGGGGSQGGYGGGGYGGGQGGGSDESIPF
jgi:single-strand DNA-binding protein